MLAESQINILTDTYWRLYDAWFVREELQQVFLERGESQYWIYKVLVKCQGQILEDGRDGYRAEMLYNQNRDLYDHLQKHCFFVKKKRTVHTARLHSRYNDDYSIEFVVRR